MSERPCRCVGYSQRSGQGIADKVLINRGDMNSVRRISVVIKKPEIHRIGQEVAHEVFAADDLHEAIDIAQTVSPDMTIFDEAFEPCHVRDYIEKTARDSGESHRTAVITTNEGPFCESRYKEAGVDYCLTEEQGPARLQAIAAELRTDAPRADAVPNDEDGFLDDTTAAVSMVGRSEAMRKAWELITLVARSQCNPVLILGDTGTGKEVAARAVHTLRHPGEPFVAVNCAALTANLLESELFGHVKGSFTGADRDKTGLLELAGSGTIFLDEISETPLELQAKLLRVLQEKTFRKVGGIKDITCQATIVASSNRDLKKEVREKRFRQDLYYRLNVCPILLAPLHSPQRREDIRLLARYFLKTSSICTNERHRITSITNLALEALCRYNWPGNVRELRNVIERAILLETTDKIGLSSIVIDPIESEDTSGGRGLRGHVKDFSLQKAERELIARALHETGWQKTQAAALLGITRATLNAKVKQYDIRKDSPARGETEFTASSVAEAEAIAVS